MTKRATVDAEILNAALGFLFNVRNAAMRTAAQNPDKLEYAVIVSLAVMAQRINKFLEFVELADDNLDVIFEDDRETPRDVEIIIGKMRATLDAYVDEPIMLNVTDGGELREIVAPPPEPEIVVPERKRRKIDA